MLLFRKEIATECIENRIRNIQQTRQPQKLGKPIKVEAIHATKSMKHLGKIMDCDMSFQSQTKTFRNMATSIRTFHQIISEPCAKSGRVFPQQSD